MGVDSREEEIWHLPVARQKHGVAADEGHDEAAHERVVGCVRLPESFVGQAVAGDALGFEGFSEFEVRETHDAEVNELRGSDLFFRETSEKEKVSI